MSLKFSVENILNLESTSQSITPLTNPYLLLNENEMSNFLLNFAFTSNTNQQKLFESLVLFGEKQKNDIQIDDDYDEIINSRSSSISSCFSSSSLSSSNSLFNQTNLSKALIFNYKTFLQTTFSKLIPDLIAYKTNLELKKNISQIFKIKKNNEIISKSNAYLINLYNKVETRSDNKIKFKLNNHKKNLPSSLRLDSTIKSKNNGIYKCETCDKVFSAHYNLTRHMPVHTGARPFICKVEIIL